MRLWLVTIGEPWPSDELNVRLHRTGIIAHQYAQMGDEVVWFNETFDHFTRCQRGEERKHGAKSPGLEILGLNGRGYRRSVSPSRMLHHGDVARDFRSRLNGYSRPDAIVASLTPLELSREAVRYGKKNNVPVVVDIRDLWPEIWIDLLPALTRPLARVALGPYFAMLREIVDGSSALCGISEEAVDWALSHGTRPRNDFDGALPLAYEPPELSAAELTAAEAFWSAHGIERDERKLTICFFGSMSNRIELDTIIQAVERAPESVLENVRLVFCGRGEAEGKLAALARKYSMVCFPGWVNAAQIEVLKRRSDIGLLPYPSTMDFTRSIPNKVFDYLAGGLPVLTCLRGVVEKLIAEKSCGWMYRNNAPDSFLDAIAMLVENRDSVAKAAASARNAGSDFSASHIYGRFRERIGQLCASSRGMQPGTFTSKYVSPNLRSIREEL